MKKEAKYLIVSVPFVVAISLFIKNKLCKLYQYSRKNYSLNTTETSKIDGPIILSINLHDFRHIPITPNILWINCLSRGSSTSLPSSPSDKNLVKK